MKLHYKNTILINENEITETSSTLVPYILHLQQVAQRGGYSEVEASMNLPGDEELLNEVRLIVAEKTTPKLKYIIDIGIGGSNLGTKAVYDALRGYFDVLEPNRSPKIIFADTNDPEVLYKLAHFIQTIDATKESFLINVISKSGGTTETIANFEIIRDAFEKRFGSINDRLVVTTDEGSRLQTAAQEKNITVLTMPKMVGGRFSIMSAVGLFPLLAAGINIDKLREGAQHMRHTCLEQKIENNPAALSASSL